MKKVHFHSLDALRFFAFLKVYLLHIPLQGNFPIFSFLKSGGGIGVAFFFVLSGFLITYLLVFEKIQNGKISIKKFFIRRSLRIWPLFFLVLIVVFILPYEFKDYIGLHMVGSGYDLDWKYSFTFLENYKMLIVDNVPKTTPLSIFWSLCIEEHFYLLWLLSLFFIPVKYVFKFLVFTFFLSWGARMFEPMLFHNSLVRTNDLFTSLDLFSCGGILGYFVAKDYKMVSVFINKISLLVKSTIVFLIVLIIVFQQYVLPDNPESYFSIFRTSVIAVLFTILIAVFIPQDSKIKINNKIINYLGSISFGLYVYHIVFIHCVFQFFAHQNILLDDWHSVSMLIIITLGGSILISMLSFHFFEKPFLKLRDIISRKFNNANKIKI